LTGSSSWLPTSSPAVITTTGSPPKPHPRFPHLPPILHPARADPRFRIVDKDEVGGGNVKFRRKCKCRTFLLLCKFFESTK
jgi:hypothetical protein